jgi:hypothetical protein
MRFYKNDLSIYLTHCTYSYIKMMIFAKTENIMVLLRRHRKFYLSRYTIQHIFYFLFRTLLCIRGCRLRKQSR